MEINNIDLEKAISTVLSKLVGINSLYPKQWTLLNALIKHDNIFYTASTNSGKTLPTVIFPQGKGYKISVPITLS